MKEISIVISTYNRNELLKETLDSIQKLEEKELFEVILVIDKNSMKVNIDQSHYDFDLIVVRNNVNCGLASNRNFGVRYAQASHILFFDDDLLIDKDAFRKIVQFKRNNPHSCLNPDWIYPPGLINSLNETAFGRFILKQKWIDYQSWVEYSNWQKNALFEVDKISGFCLLISKENFYNAGKFEESYKFMGGSEDFEFSKRLKQKGIKMYIDTNILVYHNEKDRTILSNRLKRQQIGAYNIRKSFNDGHKEFEIHYSTIKIFLLNILCFFKNFLINLANLIDNLKNPKFDGLYFRLVHILLAICIFEGYYKQRLP